MLRFAKAGCLLGVIDNKARPLKQCERKLSLPDIVRTIAEICVPSRIHTSSRTCSVDGVTVTTISACGTVVSGTAKEASIPSFARTY